MLKFAASIALIAACSDPAKEPDAKPLDDAPPIDAPAADGGMCDPGYFLTGEYVDWDSTDTVFRGVAFATFTVRGDATRTDQTSPNGRFELCMPNTATSVLDVSGGTSNNMPYTGGLVVVNKAVIAGAGGMSLRSFTAARAASFFTEQTLGSVDASKAHLLVELVGGKRAVTIDQTAMSRALNNDSWSNSNSGDYVFFANLTPGSTVISVPGAATGTGAVTLEAGKITFATILLQ